MAEHRNPPATAAQMRDLGQLPLTEKQLRSITVVRLSAELERLQRDHDSTVRELEVTVAKLDRCRVETNRLRTLLDEAGS